MNKKDILEHPALRNIPRESNERSKTIIYFSMDFDNISRKLLFVDLF